MRTDGTDASTLDGDELDHGCIDDVQIVPEDFKHFMIVEFHSST